LQILPQNFEYESIPKKAPHAYLKARLKNLSTLALLPGPANVYIDNNYISKASFYQYQIFLLQVKVEMLTKIFNLSPWAYGVWQGVAMDSLKYH
jgi:hypothetical protein